VKTIHAFQTKQNFFYLTCSDELIQSLLPRFLIRRRNQVNPLYITSAVDITP